MLKQTLHSRFFVMKSGPVYEVLRSVLVEGVDRCVLAVKLDVDLVELA